VSGIEQGRRRIVCNIKGQYVFNFLDDLVVYSRSVDEHVDHVRAVLGRFQRAGFTLNPDKVALGASEIST
jgi:hypothetical protein